MAESPGEPAGSVYVADNQTFLPIDIDRVTALATAVLESEAAADAGEVTLTFVDKDEMTRLNSTYRGKDEPTDVLSFVAAEQAGDDDFVSPVAVLGDVVVCPEVAAANAPAQGHGAEREVMEITVHGLLHLLGFDHGDPESERAMLERQTALTDKFDKPRGESA
jgi:probable rRNA maturation factor